jgi:hypothetical protein
LIGQIIRVHLKIFSGVITFQTEEITIPNHHRKTRGETRDIKTNQKKSGRLLISPMELFAPHVPFSAVPDHPVPSQLKPSEQY